MATTKAQLTEVVKRRLGYPIVKVELNDTQISDHINYARQKYIKWAVGQATQEYYFTLTLSAGQILYDMPPGCTEIVGYRTGLYGGGINTLFTLDNYLYNIGFYGIVQHGMADSWSLVSYHLARDMLETITRYTPDEYNFHYHKYTNQLEINPAPPSGGYSASIGGDINHLLLRGFFIENATPWSTSAVDLGYSADPQQQDLYGEGWILDYVTALCKISLGYIRNKFSNFASLGNIGISLDGDSMISEGKEEKEKLEEDLRLEETWEGYGMEIG